jgi:hypothetical protein
MKQTSKYWLLERGAREGNRLIFSRPWTPAIETDVRETFLRIRSEQREKQLHRQIAQYERDIAVQEFANNL